MKKIANIYAYALYLMAFFMPVFQHGFPIFIAFAAILGIAYFTLARKNLGKSVHPVLAPFSLIKASIKLIFRRKGLHFYMFIFYILYAISSIYSDNWDEVSRQLVLKSSFIYFPIMFSLTRIDNKQLLRLVDYFIAGVLVNLILSYLFAFYESNYGFDIYEFTYVNLSFTFHPSYISMFGNVAIAFCLWITHKRWEQLSKLEATLRIILIMAIALFVIMLSSKAGLGSLLIIIFIFCGYLAVKYKQIFVSIMVLILSSAFVYVTYNSVSLIGARMSVMMNEQENGASSTGSRLELWKTGLEIIQEHPFTGVGIGDVKDKFAEKLEEKELFTYLERKFNCHNQIVETGIGIGILGIVCIILMLYYFFEKTGGFILLFVSISALIGFNLFVESMFERQSGVIFITWLFSLVGSSKSNFRQIGVIQIDKVYSLKKLFKIPR